MNKFSKFLTLGFIGCLAMMGSLSADQTIQTAFSKRFNVVVIPDVWKEEVNESGNFSCEHADNEDVTFTLASGKSLKKDTSLDILEKQIKRYFDKKAATIPLFESSFGLTEEDFSEDNISFDTKIERVTIGKTKWLKLKPKGQITETVEVDGVEESRTVTPTQGIMYASFIENRMYIVTFVAPETLYKEHEKLFNTTMNMLCK